MVNSNYIEFFHYNSIRNSPNLFKQTSNSRNAEWRSINNKTCQKSRNFLSCVCKFSHVSTWNRPQINGTAYKILFSRLEWNGICGDENKIKTQKNKEQKNQTQWIEIYNHKLCDRTNCWNYIYLDPYDLTRLLYRNTVSQYRQSVTCYTMFSLCFLSIERDWSEYTAEEVEWSEMKRIYIR